METNTMKNQRREFERKIGYDAALQQHVGNEVVQFDWAKIRSCAELPHWEIDNLKHTVLDVGDFSDAWSWRFGKATETIEVQITSFRNDQLAAMKSISEFFHKSSIMPPPYDRGPKNLGTISIVFEGTSSYAVYWAFRNLKFDVDGNDKAAVLAVARCIQRAAAGNIHSR